MNYNLTYTIEQAKRPALFLGVESTSALPLFLLLPSPAPRIDSSNLTQLAGLLDSPPPPTCPKQAYVGAAQSLRQSRSEIQKLPTDFLPRHHT